MRKGTSRTGFGIAPAQTLATLLLVSTAMPMGLVATTTESRAQAQVQSSFDIPAGPLGRALAAFGRQSGTQISYDSAIAAGKTSPGMRGTSGSEQALAEILRGTGLGYTFVDARNVMIVGRNGGAGAPDAQGAVVLGTIDVTAGAPAADIPYETPGATFHVSGEQLERYRGTNTADLLKNAPGVLSGESRASAGIDVNIRGMQGQGRVTVTVDGAQNSTALYRGYQGISNSTFVDPDFIGGMDIQKGPASGATGAGAIGGSVAMRTVSVDDIVPEGENFGVRFKMEGRTNTTSPWSKPNKMSAMTYQSLPPPIEYNWKPSSRTVDRPGLLDIESGSASVLLGARTENVDVLAGFARRKYGNYHAGENGDAAPQAVPCDDTAGRPCGGIDWYRTGLTAYLPGEEVLNTSQDTYSALLKTTLRFGDDHKLDLGYSRFDSTYGETFPSSFWNNIQGMDQRNPSYVGVDSYTARYSWNPDNELIDLKWNGWLTNLEESTWSSNTKAEKWARMYGSDISNTSRFTSSAGDLALTYGLSYLHEATAPKEHLGYGIPPREGTRQETSVFTDARWSPLGWLDLDGGVRWHSYESRNTLPGNTDPVSRDQVWDYSAGVTVKPLNGLQLFGTYKNASRLPSLFESTGGFMTEIDPNLSPERSSTWEIGANVMLDGVLRDDDGLRFKASYFDSTVDDYINRTWKRECRIASCTWSWQYAQFMYISNIARARFSGVDLSARYETGGFTAELAGTYYNEVVFCRTLGTCTSSSLAADYATNHVPPKYSASLTLSQRLLEDRLTVGTRISHVGPRAASAEPTSGGANPFISQIPWKPYTLVDLFLSYKPNDAVSINLGIENLMDIYYVDPLSLALMPSPGRTITFGITSDLTEGALTGLTSIGEKGRFDWTGFHAGLHGQLAMAKVEAHQLEDHAGTLGDFHLPQLSGAGFGGQAGYTHHFNNNFILGLEGSFSIPDLKRRSPTTQWGEIHITTDVDWLASARLKAGFAADRFKVYGLAGYTAAGVTGTYERAAAAPYGVHDSASVVHGGWTVGGGLEYGITENLSLVGEYSFTKLAGKPIAPPDAWVLDRTYTGRDQLDWDPKLTVDEFRIGLNYRF